jgi:hypothetical protein
MNDTDEGNAPDPASAEAEAAMMDEMGGAVAPGAPPEIAPGEPLPMGGEMMQ